MTEQVTKPIEQSIASVPRLKRSHSSSANSIAIVVAQFEFGTDIKEARSTIEQNLQLAGLPAERLAAGLRAQHQRVAGHHRLRRGTSPDGLDAATEVARTQIVPDLQGIDGVATVDLAGGLQQRVVVTLDPAKLTATGISVAQVNGVLAANNLTLPSGQIKSPTTNMPVSTIGSFTSIAQIENLVVGVKTAGGRRRAGTGSGAAPAPSAAPAASPPRQLRRAGELRPPRQPRPPRRRRRRSSSRTSPPSTRRASPRPASAATTASRP